MRSFALILTLLFPAIAEAASITASRTLPAGTVISRADVVTEDEIAPGELAALIGLQTRITIYAGRPISPNHVRKPHLIARNQIVPLTFQRGALQIKTEGRALAAGGAGDIIPVMNSASRNTVSAVVGPDGTLSVSR